MKIGHYIMNYKKMDEGVLLDEGAVPWDDLTEFYKKADKTDLNKAIEYIKNDEWDKFKQIVNKVIKKK